MFAPIAGFLVYAVYMQVATGDALAALEAERSTVSQWSVWNVFDPGLLLKNLFSRPLVLHNPLDSAFDRAFFVVFLVSLPLVYRKVDKTLFCCCLVLGLQPLLGSFMSYMRYVMLVFPLYIGYASWVTKVANEWRPEWRCSRASCS